ncbi:MAG TPA: hypothetical protein VFT53_01425 [Candidatus Saccharimonadales bacterium]|nr:hypothetical protein [Candidatus Saccharimonadales bacterium]
MRTAYSKILTACGLLLLVISLILPWTDGMHARGIPLQRLWSAGTVAPVTEVAQSAAIIVAMAAFLCGLSLLVSRVWLQRLLLGLGMALGFATVVLWGTMEAIYKAPGNFTVVNIQIGAWAACLGVLLVIIGFVWTFRRLSQK